MTLQVDPLGAVPGQSGAVTQRVRIAGTASASSTWDLQVASNANFQFCVCPIFNVPFNANGYYDMQGLNPLARHYFRARERFSNGAVDEWSNVTAFTTLTDGMVRALGPAAIMIEPAIIVLPEALITVASSATKAGFPPSNMARADATAFRMGEMSAGVYYFDVEHSGAPIDTIALLNTNLPEGSVWYAEGANVPIRVEADIKYRSPGAASRPFRASPSLPGRPGYHGLMVLPVAQTYRWWRIVIALAPTTGSLLHVQNLIMGLNRASKNHSVDKVETPTPLTTIERKRSGVFDRVPGLPMRRVEFELSNLTEMQYETIYGDLWRYENEPVLVIPNSKSGAFLHDRILFGDLTGGRILNPSSPRFSRQFAVNSII